MRAFKVFIFGLLYGWFLKFSLDRIYRENELEDLRHENASLQEYIRTLESKFQAKQIASKAVASSAPSPEPVQARSEKDDLKVIRGIGPAIEKRLNNAGIQTFEALAGLSVEQLEGILGNARRLAQESDLIDQAKKLARENHR